MAIHIVEEAERCLGCKRPQCQQGCPVGTNIPAVIALFKERKINDAGAMLFENNPMSAVCSLICNHSAQCEGHCVRGRKGSPVHFSAIESYISGTYLDRMRLVAGEKVDKRVAVIVAVSQKPRNVLISTTEGLEGDERGLLVVDEQGATTVPGVYAAGDVVTGPKTVVHAVEAAKRAADGILSYLGVEA